MATVTPTFEDRSMSIGRVFDRAFTAIRNNPVVILGLALVVGALPGLIAGYLLVQLGFGSPATIASQGLGRVFATGFISWAVTMAIAAIAQAALTRATVSASEGRKASFGESLATGFRVFLPVIALSLVLGISVAFGFILLIVPGFILLVMWSVGVPALVIERKGVFPSLVRSSVLTKGARWKIFGLFLALGALYWLLSIAFGVVGLKMYGPTSATGLNVGNLVGSLVLGTIFNALWGTLQPSLYVELRQWKDGTSVDALEQVFA